MSYQIVRVFYLCPRCLEPAGEPTPCPRCGGQRVDCRPGGADDPRRSPLISAGRVRSHAPLWWLERSAIWITETK